MHVRASLAVLAIVVEGCDAPDHEKLDAGLMEALEEANYCDQKEDCVDLGPICPLGCAILVNADEAEAWEILLMSYESDCDFKCPSNEGATCVDGQCSSE